MRRSQQPSSQKASRSPEARGLALRILAAAGAQGARVEDLLAATLRQYPSLPRTERHFLLELVQGVKRWEIQLDYFLAQVSHLPLRKLHPLVLVILRLTAYQLFHLDRVPVWAAVAEAGRLAKARRLPQAHVGYINALLRRLTTAPPPQLPALKDDAVQSLSLATAHPAWLVDRWLRRYGLASTQAKLNADNRLPPLTIRVNTLKTEVTALQARLAREGVTSEPCRYSPVGLHLTSLATSPPLLPSYQEGLWLFQDEASQLVGGLLPLTPGSRLLEIGAGRGGKTSHLAARMGNRGICLALDYHRGRVQELCANLSRLGVTSVTALLADATQSIPLKPASFDAILIDAPCSALGVVRRHPEIKTRLKETDLATFPPRQRAMLDQAGPLLRPGGWLLYATCTTEPAENEDLILAFLKTQPGFRLAPAADFLPPAAAELAPQGDFFFTSPESHDLDGFFGALMVKETEG